MIENFNYCRETTRNCGGPYLNEDSVMARECDICPYAEGVRRNENKRKNQKDACGLHNEAVPGRVFQGTHY